MLLRALSTLYTAVLVAVLFLRSSFTPPDPWAEAAPGTKGDHLARWRYEFDKLKDPATGDIPLHIRKRELAFARTLPSRERMNGAQKGSAIQNINWEFRGPENLGGRTRAMAVDVSNENVLIAGGVSGGMWRSEDKGQTWARTSKLSDLKSVTCLVQDKRPGKTNVWYYGTGEARANSAGMKTQYYGDGISRSTDGGRSWQQLDATVSRTPHRFDDFDYIMELAVDPSNLTEDEVYCATTRAIYRSTDGGINWDVVLGSASGNGSYASLHATHSGVMYATIPSQSQSSGIYRSVDGITWVNITPSTFSRDFERAVIASAPLDEDQVYIFMSTPADATFTHTLLKYTYLDGDGRGEGNGAWEDRSEFLPPDLEAYDSYCMALAVHATDPNMVYLGGSRLYRSPNGFASHTGRATISRGEGPFHADQHVIAPVASKPNEYYVANDGGVYHTDNINDVELTWSDRNQGYVTSQFYTVAVDHETDGSDLVMGGLQDNGTWISQGNTRDWLEVWGADGGFAKIMEQGSIVYAAWQSGVIYRLRLDEFGSVYDWTRIDPMHAWNYLFINPYAVDPNDNSVVYTAEGQNIWRTTDGLLLENSSDDPATVGWTWFRAATNQQVTALSVSRKPENILYYGTRNGQIYRMDNASDETSTPRLISSGKGLPAGYVSAISIDPYNADRVMVSYSNYGILSIAFTSDGGETWSIVSGNLEENANGTGAGPAVKWVATLPARDKTVYLAGTTTGLYSTYKLDGMNTVWVQEAESLIGNTVVDMIDVRHYDGFVAVATHGSGVYSAKIDIQGGPLRADETPTKPTLALSVSPNPSNTYSRIAFELQEYSPVAIQIIDIEGKVVYSQHADFPAGRHAVKWNGLDRFNQPVPAGAYTISVRAANGEDRRRIVRVK